MIGGQKITGMALGEGGLRIGLRLSRLADGLSPGAAGLSRRVAACALARTGRCAVALSLAVRCYPLSAIADHRALPEKCADPPANVAQHRPPDWRRRCR